MKTTRIIIGIAAALILPLTGATAARAVSGPSATQAGASANLQGGASHAYNYGRDSQGKNGKDSKNGKGRHGSKGSKKGGKGSHGSRGGHGSKSECKRKRG